LKTKRIPFQRHLVLHDFRSAGVCLRFDSVLWQLTRDQEL
jgi:hypothetical protein